MPSCAIITCRARSQVSSVAKGGFSYHRFPSDPNIKEKWMAVTGRKDWFPTKTSTICSKHFRESDYAPSKSGKMRQLNHGALPVLNIVRFYEQEQHTQPSTSSTCLSKVSSNTSTKNQNYKPPEASSASTKLERNLIELVNTKDRLLKKKQQLIKQLQARNRRLKKKLENAEKILAGKEDTQQEKRNEIEIVFANQIKEEMNNEVLIKHEPVQEELPEKKYIIVPPEDNINPQNLDLDYIIKVEDIKKE